MLYVTQEKIEAMISGLVLTSVLVHMKKKKKRKKLRNKCRLLICTENLIWSKYKLLEVSFYTAGKLLPHSSEEVCTDTPLILEKKFPIALIECKGDFRKGEGICITQNARTIKTRRKYFN